MARSEGMERAEGKVSRAGGPRAGGLVLWLLLAAFVLLVNLRAYRPGNVHTAFAQLRHLHRALEQGAAQEMQALFPEGYVFTWALFGLASAQVAGQLPAGDTRRSIAADYTRQAIEHVDSDRARETFVEEMLPPWGAFYRSWSLYLKAVALRGLGPSMFTREWIVAFERACDELALALEQGSSPFLCSYPGQAWPADTVVGIGALAIHDQVLPPRYGSVLSRWIMRARELTEPGTPALAHAADRATGAPRQGIRGSSLALMCRVLADVDPAWACEQYSVLRKDFVREVFGISGVREYPAGRSGSGDVDSGPIVLGFSGPAIVVGIGAARALGDLETARRLLGVVEVVGVPIDLAGRRTYAAGIMPIGDAFLAWARSTPTPASGICGPAWTNVLSGRGVLLLHVLSAAILFMSYRALARPRPRRSS